MKVVRSHPPESGFSLLEVIVATMIVAIVFASMMEIFSSGLRTEGVADEYATAMLRASRVMNDLSLHTTQAQPSKSEGRFEDGASWRASADLYRPPDESAAPPSPLPFERMLLHVEVFWTSRGSEKKVQLESIKNVLRESSKS